MTDTLGRKLTGLLPGPVLVVFGQYIAPFAVRRLIPSADQIEASCVGAGVGLVLSVALRPVLIGRSDRVKQGAAVVSLVATLVLLWICYHLWTLLAPALQPAEAQAIQGQQYLAFVAAMGMVCLTFSLASLAYPSSNRWVIVIAGVVAGVVVLGVVGYFAWQRYS
jgi:hypothetical protein